jgi:hypothetical protein
MTESHREQSRAPGARLRSTPEVRGLPLAPALLAVIAMLALAGWAAGCGQGRGGPAAAGTAGSPPASSTTGPLPAACELLTPADVDGVTKEVSGSLSSTLEDAVGKDPSQCSYPLGSEVPSKVVSLAVRHLASPDQAASQQQAAEAGLRSMVAGAQVEDLPSVGDGAFWIGGRIDQLNVRRGATLLVFTVQLDGQPERAARTLADKALARLAASAATPSSAGRRPVAKP